MNKYENYIVNLHTSKTKNKDRKIKNKKFKKLFREKKTRNGKEIPKRCNCRKCIALRKERLNRNKDDGDLNEKV